MSTLLHSAWHKNQRNSMALRVLCFSFVCLVLSSSLFACASLNKSIKSATDKGKGEWIRITDTKYEYRISKSSMEHIFQQYDSIENEKWRSEKILVAFAYTYDIDPSFSSLGENSASIQFFNNNTILIKNDKKTYTMTLKAYKKIYFPISIELGEI